MRHTEPTNEMDLLLLTLSRAQDEDDEEPQEDTPDWD